MIGQITPIESQQIDGHLVQCSLDGRRAVVDERLHLLMAGRVVGQFRAQGKVKERLHVVVTGASKAILKVLPVLVDLRQGTGEKCAIFGCAIRG